MEVGVESAALTVDIYGHCLMGELSSFPMAAPKFVHIKYFPWLARRKSKAITTVDGPFYKQFNSVRATSSVSGCQRCAFPDCPSATSRLDMASLPASPTSPSKPQPWARAKHPSSCRQCQSDRVGLCSGSKRDAARTIRARGRTGAPQPQRKPSRRGRPAITVDETVLYKRVLSSSSRYLLPPNSQQERRGSGG